MKKYIHILILGIISLSNSSCDDIFGETCTSGYVGHMKIDGKKNDKVFVKYIGPDKRKYKTEFRFDTELNVPYFGSFIANSICSSKDFRKKNYDFLEIQNLSSENIYICAVLSGAEVDKSPNYVRYVSLLAIYGKQDKDPTYDYTKDKEFEGVKLDYVDRYEFYEQLLKENYPYIIKLEPKKICIMKWNNLGFKVL